jgi:DNA-binding CsgD family transcriptional regulator
MTRTEAALWVLDEMKCGALLLDDAGTVMAVNACAERTLARYATENAKTRSRNWSARTLRRMFGKAFATAEVCIAIANDVRSAHARPLVAYRVPLGESADRRARTILVLVDLAERSQPSIDSLRCTFGLTLAEARLAAQLGMGKSLQEIAAAQKVSIDTVRAQLKTALAKTHTHRQAELVALVNRLTPLP